MTVPAAGAVVAVVLAIQASAYADHVRLSKKFYESMMQSLGTKPVVVARILAQILQDADNGVRLPASFCLRWAKGMVCLRFFLVDHRQCFLQSARCV